MYQMGTVYKDLTIDLFNPYPLPILNAKQYDTGRGVHVTLKAGSDLFVPAGEVAIYILKPDGTKIYNACTVEDAVVTVNFTNQALAVAGDAQAEIQVTYGADIVSTPIFVIRVLKSNIDDDAIESTDEFTALETAIATLSTYDAINCLPLVTGPTAVTSLADAFDAQPNHRICYFRCSSVTTDKAPNATNAGVLSYRYYGSAAYGAQLSFSAAGLYVRTCSSGTWSAWAAVTTA